MHSPVNTPSPHNYWLVYVCAFEVLLAADAVLQSVITQLNCTMCHIGKCGVLRRLFQNMPW